MFIKHRTPYRFILAYQSRNYDRSQNSTMREPLERTRKPEGKLWNSGNQGIVHGRDAIGKYLGEIGKEKLVMGGIIWRFEGEIVRRILNSV